MTIINNKPLYINMKTHTKLFVASLVLGIFLAFAGSTYASIPMLSLSSTGTGDSVNVTVTGDSNSNVTLYYNLGYGVQNRMLGTTNNNGFFFAIISTSSYGITPGMQVYAMVNNQQSPTFTWPYSSSSSYSPYSSLSLSQTNLSLAVGQTSTITTFNNYNYGTLYVSNNSNPNVATATVNGNNNISIYAINSGTTTITICQNNSGSSCGTVYVTVGGGYNTGGGYYAGYGGYTFTGSSNANIGLNISNLSLPVGSSITVSASDYNVSQGIYVSNNSNPNVASITYSPLSSSATVCAGNTLYNTITGAPCYGGANLGTPYYSPSYIPGCTAYSQYSVTTGQPCFGGYGYNSINNSSGNNISIVVSALTVGTDTVTLCQNNGNTCTPIYISVIR